MAMNTAQIASLLRPGLDAVFGDYDTYPAQWTEIFARHDSNMEREIDVEMKLTGLASIVNEGAPIPMDEMGERFKTNYVHKYVGIGTVVTRKAIKDNLYKKDFPNQARALKRSLLIAKETLGAAILNNGFNPAFPIGDGKPLFDTGHPIDNGTVSNRANPAVDLSEAGLEDGLIQIRTFLDQAGLLVNTSATKLIVPNELEYTSQRLLGSQFRVDTNNNDINAIYNMQAIPQGWRVNRYLTNPKAWFLLTDAPHGFKHFVREPIEHNVYAEIHTYNVIANCIERYSFGCSNFRAAYGSQGT